MLKKFRDEISQLKGQKAILIEQGEAYSQTIKELEQEYIEMEEAQKIAQDVALATQNKLRLAIEPIVASAMEIVFKDEAYGFKVEFDTKAGKSACTLKFTKNGYYYTPMASSGFGVVDVAAFALRLAIWNISNPKSRGVFILDEPFKHVSEDLQENVFTMVKTLSEKLGIQLIIVSHNKEADVFENSDRVFKCSLDKNRVTQIKVLK